MVPQQPAQGRTDHGVRQSVCLQGSENCRLGHFLCLDGVASDIQESSWWKFFKLNCTPVKRAQESCHVSTFPRPLSSTQWVPLHPEHACKGRRQRSAQVVRQGWTSGFYFSQITRPAGDLRAQPPQLLHAGVCVCRRVGVYTHTRAPTPQC